VLQCSEAACRQARCVLSPCRATGTEKQELRVEARRLAFKLQRIGHCKVIRELEDGTRSPALQQSPYFKHHASYSPSEAPGQTMPEPAIFNILQRYFVTTGMAPE
jgi:hypothetical protein